jgi:hypothetical protein
VRKTPGPLATCHIGHHNRTTRPFPPRPANPPSSVWAKRTGHAHLSIHKTRSGSRVCSVQLSLAYLLPNDQAGFFLGACSRPATFLSNHWGTKLHILPKHSSAALALYPPFFPLSPFLIQLILLPLPTTRSPFAFTNPICASHLSMVHLREIPRTAVFAWSPGTGRPFLVTGTRAGAVDADFSDETKLEIWDLSLDSPDHGLELQPIHSISTDSR